MEWPNWNCQYDNDKIVARIIIDWGHNMCEYWIKEYCYRGQLYCPQCLKTYPPRLLNEYPKNIAIKSLKNCTSIKSLDLKRCEKSVPMHYGIGHLLSQSKLKFWKLFSPLGKDFRNFAKFIFHQFINCNES